METAAPATVRQVVAETRQNYVRNMSRLLEGIHAPKALLWLSKRPPRYVIDDRKLHGILNAHPQLVDDIMLDQLRGHADAVVECVSSAGLPRRLWPAAEPLPGTVLAEGVLTNRYYPSPEMHALAAAKLAGACRSILHSAR